MIALHFMVTVRLDDDKPELMVYCCHASSAEDAIERLKKALPLRGVVLKEIIDCRELPPLTGKDIEQVFWDDYQAMEFK